MEFWKDGMVENWNGGTRRSNSIIPNFHYSSKRILSAFL
jgi:hypothetical protein